MSLKTLNQAIRRPFASLKPPEQLTVSQWADKYRRLSPESSAEIGPWRTKKTPYLKDVMDAWTDTDINHIVMVAASQVGKSEALNNIIGYIIDQDPGSILLIEPTTGDAREYSKLRIAPMIRDCKTLRRKVAASLRGDGSNTILQKAYPGGMITLTGSTEAHALASKPIRYVLGDERDRWAVEAGKEGDPWRLAMARQRTFYNAKAYECSTPTIKGYSPIEKSFKQGTQERWCSRCPHCGEYHNIRWQDIRYSFDQVEVEHETTYIVTEVYYICPECAAISGEHDMKRAHAKWIAENPEARRNGIRSFWLNAFCSPWVSWEKIVTEYLKARNDTNALKVVYNTLFGELWEDRGGLATEDDYLARREEYTAELPDGVLVLTAGVDVQDDRLEYEVVGWGLRKENWGIRRGILMGRPDDPETWRQLDDVIDHVYRFGSGKGLKISMTFVDDGGHFTQYTRWEVSRRINKRMFDCKGFWGDGRPYTAPPKKVNIMIQGRYIGNCWQYQLGVDAGKQMIMDALKIQTPGPRFCHFPINEDRGYGHAYFVGLLSEHLVYKEHKQNPWVWEKIPGHERNEPLDCRNYALAAFTALSPDLDALHRRANGLPATMPDRGKRPAQASPRRSPADKLADQMNKLMDW